MEVRQTSTDASLTAGYVLRLIFTILIQNHNIYMCIIRYKSDHQIKNMIYCYQCFLDSSHIVFEFQLNLNALERDSYCLFKKECCAFDERAYKHLQVRCARCTGVQDVCSLHE